MADSSTAAESNPHPADIGPAPEIGARKESRRRIAGCFVLLLVALQVTIGPKVRLSQWDLSSDTNAGVAEATAWLDGRLNIPHDGRDAARDRMHDTAYFDGKVFNVFPPLIGFLTVLTAPLHQLLTGDSGRWLNWTYALLIFWPLPIAAFVVFRRQTGDSVWGAVLAGGFIAGTAVLPNLYWARFGHLGQMYHVTSQVGLLILAADLLGRQRVWPGLIGLAIAVWSRQMTGLYALPLLWIAARQKRLPLCLSGLVLIAAPFLVLNQLKFGSPIESGYRYIYENRDDAMAQRCQTFGVLSPHFIPENLYYMHAAIPHDLDVGLTSMQLYFNDWGTSIWMTTPLLAAVLIFARRWWADRDRRLLILATLPIMLGLLCYHSPGFRQAGYHRFALDFIPIWLVVTAPYICRGRWAWFTIACTAWSVLYFTTIANA